MVIVSDFDFPYGGLTSELGYLAGDILIYIGSFWKKLDIVTFCKPLAKLRFKHKIVVCGNT